MKSGFNEEIMKQKLSASSKRLTRFIEVTAPDDIICNEVAIMLKYCFVLYGDKMGKALGNCLGSCLRNYYGLCEDCFSPLTDRKESKCIKCNLNQEMELGDMEEEIDEALEEEVDELDEGEELNN